MWMMMAWLSAICSAGSTILAKHGIRKTDSTLATALRTGVVLVCAWAMTGMTGSWRELGQIGGIYWFWILLSGLATGLSWLCYYRALSIGDAGKTMPIEKSSIVITLTVAIVFFHERSYLVLKILCMIVICLGTLFLFEKEDLNRDHLLSTFMRYALLAAVFAALNSIFSKLAMAGMESNLGTALNTSVVMIEVWLIVAAQGKGRMLREIGGRELGFVLASGLATGACWLTFYYALKHGPVTAVLPINKMSVPIVVIYSALVLHEKTEKREALGLILMFGAMLVIAFVGG